jgi:hypothetical protein
VREGKGEKESKKGPIEDEKGEGDEGGARDEVRGRDGHRET